MNTTNTIPENTRSLKNYINNFKSKVITVPKGNNVGKTVHDSLVACGLRNIIEIKSINTTLDRINRDKIVHLEYVFKA